jgi:hypothetical protein
MHATALSGILRGRGITHTVRTVQPAHRYVLNHVTTARETRVIPRTMATACATRVISSRPLGRGRERHALLRVLCYVMLRYVTLCYVILVIHSYVIGSGCHRARQPSAHKIPGIATRHSDIRDIRPLGRVWCMRPAKRGPNLIHDS